MAKIIIEYAVHEYCESEKQDIYEVSYPVARAIDTLISDSKKKVEAEDGQNNHYTR